MKRDGVFSRNGHFYISWQDVAGKRRKRMTHATSLNEARGIRAEELRKVEQARVLGFVPPTEQSFEQLSKEYLQHQAATLTPDILRRETDIFRIHLNPFFAGPIKDVKYGKVQKYLLKRNGDKAAPATIRKELQVLKHFFTFAVQMEYLPSSPALGVKGPKVPEKEAEFVPRQQFPDLLTHCPRWLQLIVLFATATGFRRRNILMLEWRDINLETRIVILRETKTGEMLRFALNDFAMAVLNLVIAENGNALPASKRAKVFGYIGAPTNVSVRFKRAARKAGIPDVHFHSLRHTFGSWAVMNGNDLSAVQKWMGHKTPRMTARYAHLSPAYMQREMQTLNGAFTGLLPEKSGDATGTNDAHNGQHPATSGNNATIDQTRMNTGENALNGELSMA